MGGRAGGAPGVHETRGGLMTRRGWITNRTGTRPCGGLLCYHAYMRQTKGAKRVADNLLSEA